MKLDQLRTLAEQAKTHPNYQFRDKTEAELLVMAKKSFTRLIARDRQRALDSWKKALIKEDQATEDHALEFIIYRFLAQTNLFFLCNMLGYYKFKLDTHEDICNNFFVQKNPVFRSFDEFAHQYTDLKDRMLLVPRGGYKSTMNIADCVQWVICFPEVTILILTGVYKLASDFVGELKMHFTLEDANDRLSTYRVDKKYEPRNMADPVTGEWSKSMFQILFPEHCVTPSDGSQFEFQTPVGGDAREPSVRAASIEQALSGMHFGILKLDDVVHNENSTTMERLEKINKQIDVNNAMLHPHGFNDVIGTWYDEFDYYGTTIRDQETKAREQNLPDAIQGSVDSGKYNCDLNDFRVYLRSAWWPKESAKGKIEEQMTASDYDLWFPEGLPYEFLIRKRRQSADGFAIKYLNNPRKIHRIKFPRELLLSKTIPHEQMPMQGIVVTAVDTAYSTKQWADYTVAITAVIYGGRFYVINMTRGRFNEYDLPKVLANIAYTWKPKRMAIEDSIGVKWMGRELRREMDKLSISVPVEYINLGYGTKLRSKQLKAKPVLRLLGDDRMFFRNSCEGLNDIYEELEKFTGTSDDKHDDIVSALSLLAEQFGAYAEMEQKIDYASTQFTSDRQSKDRHDLIYGLGQYAYLNAGALGDHPTTMFQIENSPITELEIDPLADLFK